MPSLGSPRIETLDVGPLRLELEVKKRIGTEDLKAFDEPEPSLAATLTVIDRRSSDDSLAIPMMFPETWNIHDVGRYALLDLLKFGDHPYWGKKGVEDAGISMRDAGVITEEQRQEQLARFSELIDWSAAHQEEIKKALEEL
jgi:hypothetical protein